MATPPLSDFPAHLRRLTEDTASPHTQLGRPGLLAVGALLAALLALFWKVVFTPAMFYYRDVFNYSYPHARFIHEVCRQGYLPYWNPYLNFGEPVLANPNFLFFYPYTLLLILLPIDFAYTMHYIVHFAAAGIGTYVFARRWQQSRGAAVFAAFVFMLSGPMLSLGNLYNHVAAAAWIPWALLLTDVAAVGRSWRPWILLTLVFTLQFLAAEPFTLIATFGLAVAYALYCCGNRHKLISAPNLRILGRFAAVGGLMIALSAVQFLPSLDLLRNSRRGVEGLPFNETTSWSFHPLQTLELLVPNLFGTSLDAPSLWTLVLSGRNMPYFPSVFLGFVPVFFALVGWGLGSHRRRNFVAAAAIALLLITFGRYTPLFSFLYLLLPPLALVRFPVKLLVPLALMVALLAGWGIDAVRRAEPLSPARRRRVLVPLALVLAGAAIVWIVSWIAPRWIDVPASWLLLRTNAMHVRNAASELLPEQVAEAAELFRRLMQVHLPGLAGFALGGILWLLALGRGKGWARHALVPVAILGLVQVAAENYSVNPTVPKSFYTYRPPVLAHFEETHQPYRFAYVFREAKAPSAAPDVQGFLNFESVPEAKELPPLAQMAFRDRLVLARGTMLEKVEGISNIDVERSFPPFLYEFWVYALKNLGDSGKFDCLLGRANVRYQVLRARDDRPVGRIAAPIFNGSPQPSYLYENPCLLPRAFVVGSAHPSANAGETLARMTSPDFNPSKEVILATRSIEPQVGEQAGETGRVEIVQREADAVTLHARLQQPAYVVLLDRYDPNWHATLDGREVPVLRANQIFRAVRVEPGPHEIRFFYRQRGLTAGLIISLVTLGLVGIVFVFDPGSRRPRVA